MQMICQRREQTIERWKIDLVRARAIRLGFRGAELEDAQQQVLLEAIAFKFQPERANGATEATALVALIDHRLLMVRRRERRYQRHFEQTGESAGTDDCATEPAEMGHEGQVDRVLDVQEVVARLVPEDRELCRALAAGQSIDAIAGRLRCSWHTVKRRVDELRRLFERLGLDGCVD